jgi:hypothetical protein
MRFPTIRLSDGSRVDGAPLLRRGGRYDRAVPHSRLPSLAMGLQPA